MRHEHRGVAFGTSLDHDVPDVIDDCPVSCPSGKRLQDVSADGPLMTGDTVQLDELLEQVSRRLE